MFDRLYPAGMQWYWKADFVRTISDEAIAQHLKYAAKLPTLESTMHLYPINGAAGRVKKSATPWWHRDATWTEVIVGVDPDPEKKEEITAWAKEYWSALHPYSAGGAYVNFMMEEGEERIRATYGKNYDRLAKIKKRYDPANLFRVNKTSSPPSNGNISASLRAGATPGRRVWGPGARRRASRRGGPAPLP
jgi:FAD/FMN-containing dehydrogenase